MRITLKGQIIRTDIWREGAWLDLWSVVHFLTGLLIGLAGTWIPVHPTTALVLTLAGLIAYECWEVYEQITEEPTNRFMDVVVGMVSFTIAYLYLSPILTPVALIICFALIFVANVLLSIAGWRASQKAAALAIRVRARYARQRVKLLERKARLSKLFRRNHTPR